MRNETIDRENEPLVLLSLSRGAESRRKILTMLSLGPQNCNQIANELDLDWWSVQKHLNLLLKANLVKSIGFGRIRFYKLTANGEDAMKRICAHP
jgi:predicted transcriptional regulator